MEPRRLRRSRWEAAQIVPAPGGVLAAQMAEPLRVTETLQPVCVKQLTPGVYIFDMGQNMVGWCRLKVAGPQGAQVTLRHAETLNPDGSLYVANLRSARATDVYTLEGRRHGDLGAALHLSRLSLRRDHRLSRASPRPRRSRAGWCMTT